MSQEETIEQLQAENARLKEEKARESAEKDQAEAENRQLWKLVEELLKCLHEKMQEEAENAELGVEKQRLHQQIEELSIQVQELKGRIAKNSSNSSKPPSTDGYAKKTRSLRQKSGKKPGGQEGHVGCTRSLVETPDEVIVLWPEKCSHCQASLHGVQAEGYERRQKVDLPEIKAQVTEYQAQDVRCPNCQHVTRGTFPDEVRARVQFGPMVKGITLYLLYGQFLPYARTAELLTDLCGCPLSPGTLETFVAEGADRLVEAEEQIKQALRAAEVAGTDETSTRVQGILHWLHVVRTDKLTHYAVHRKRGKAATDAIGILPHFKGPWSMTVTVAILNIPNVRMPSAMLILFGSCAFSMNTRSKSGRSNLKSIGLPCLTQVEEARARGETHLSTEVITSLTATYHQRTSAGLAAQPPPPSPLPKKKGKVKQTKAKNLLDRLQRDAASFLLFLSDFRVPFTNNGSEQDLRMVKVQQKISGTFRSETGPVAFCRIRGYFSTMSKQGYHPCTVARQIFVGVPLSPLAAL